MICLYHLFNICPLLICPLPLLPLPVSYLISFATQTLHLVELLAQPWASGSPAPWRASRRPCRRLSEITSTTKCPSIALGSTWCGGAGATRASALLSTSPMMDLLKTVGPTTFLYVGAAAVIEAVMQQNCQLPSLACDCHCCYNIGLSPSHCIHFKWDTKLPAHIP